MRVSRRHRRSSPTSLESSALSPNLLLRTTIDEERPYHSYRNAQMMFSSLRHLDAYSSLNDPSPKLPPIPTILELQNILELAWNQGQIVGNHSKPTASSSLCFLQGTTHPAATTSMGSSSVQRSGLARPRSTRRCRGWASGKTGSVTELTSHTGAHLAVETVLRVKLIDFPKVPGSGSGTHGTLVVS